MKLREFFRQACFRGKKYPIFTEKLTTHSFKELKNICKRVQNASSHISGKNNFAILSRAKVMRINATLHRGGRRLLVGYRSRACLSALAFGIYSDVW